ncbi:clotting factor B-like [Toxorhynchites rutilus septentrionalis]|uniref:clotting factor B-like n=1 Tax=Toxorhynchites rutilus septentrionalis TaxID=329112 RepID=UPI0024788FE8|nr:clotting factor B-like [Toxorhynchites rutilus septentrionalis]
MHNARMTPFVVGVTSFGTACGMSVPGVYTKIAPYHDWIVETMLNSGVILPNNVFNATFCALRFAYFREYEDAMIMERTPNYVAVDSDRRHMFLANGLPSYVVQLAWKGKTNNCCGVIIDEDTVLMLAQCVTKNGERVSHINYSNNVTMEVSKIHIHPNYKQGSSYNNIAILRLQKFLDFQDLDPPCLWQEKSISQEVHVHGSGRRDINFFLYMSAHIKNIDPSITILTPRVRFQNASTCIIPKRYLPLLRNGLTDEHICNGQNLFLVPKSCELVTGGALHTSDFKYLNFYPMVYGLNYLGRECGFGEHAIAISVANYAEWMKSVLFSELQAIPWYSTVRRFGSSRG